jgi:arylsulfatase A-like enzyme
MPTPPPAPPLKPSRSALLTRGLGPILAGAALLACGDPPQIEPSDVGAGRPKTVIMVVACTMRAERLGAYGNTRDTSPYIDALARSGTRFDEMLSNAPWTRPGIGALVTGAHPLRLGVDIKDQEVGFNRGISPEIQTTAERFQADGWHTIGVTSNPNANARFGFGQGFDSYDDTGTVWQGRIDKIDGDDVIDTFVEKAREVEGKLYGMVVLVDTHRPLDWLGWRRASLGLSPFRYNLVDQYDAAVTLVDEHVRDLDRALTDMGREDRLLVFVGDHGEGLRIPKRAGSNHARRLYNGNLKVPWILHGSRVGPDNVVEGLARSIDVAPTVLDLVGIERDASLDGVSLKEEVQGKRRITRVRDSLSVTRYGGANKSRITTEGWIYIQSFPGDVTEPEGREELYRSSDLAQSEDLFHDEPVRAEHFQRKMNELREGYEARQLTWESQASEADLEQLRALGYLEDEDGDEGDEGGGGAASGR